jgi:hypothetical protein
MPGDLDGIDFANLVRKSWPGIRVLVTSGFHDGRLEALDEGIRFLPTPRRALE